MVKSKFIKEKKKAEQEAIRKLYATGEYSMRDLRDQFKRSLQYIVNAIHAEEKLSTVGSVKPLDTKNKK